MWWRCRSLRLKIIRTALCWGPATLHLMIIGLIDSKILKMISWDSRKTRIWVLTLTTLSLLSRNQTFVESKERVSKKQSGCTFYKHLSKFAVSTPTSEAKATSKSPWQPKTKTSDQCLPFKARPRATKKKTFAKWATCNQRNSKPAKKPMTSSNSYSRCSSPSMPMMSTRTWDRALRRKKDDEKERSSSGKWRIQPTYRCLKIRRKEVISICGYPSRLRRITPSINHLRRMRDTYLSETKALSQIKNSKSEVVSI